MLYRFGAFEVDTRRQVLLRDSEEVPLEPQVYQLLVLLLDEYDNVVTTDQILDQIWGGRIVSEAAIASRVHAVRKALGDDGRNQALIRTVRGTGFRFVGELTSQSNDIEPAAKPVQIDNRTDGRPTVAILPFQQDAAAADGYLADSLIEGLTTALSRVKEFAVIARQSVLSSALEGETGIAAAERLGATYVLEGSVRRGGQRVRVNITMTRSYDGHCVWSEQFDDEIDDFFSIQDRLVVQITGQLAPNVRAIEVSRANERAQNERSAYETTLTALPLFWRCDYNSHSEAIARFERAIELDPTYAPARAYYAWCRAQGANSMWSDDPDAVYRAAETQARAALAQADDHAPSLVAIGAALTLATNDMALAKTVLERALSYDPSNAWGWLRIGWVHYMTGEPERGLEALARAEVLSPFDPFQFNFWFARAACHISMGELGKAIEANSEGGRCRPGTPWADRQLIGFQALRGDDAGVKLVAQRMLKSFPDLTAKSVMQSLPPCHPQKNAQFVAKLQNAGFQ